MQENPTVIDEPVAGFEVSDLFLSRTDARGIILSGNATFQQLAGYEWSELINSPHRMVRHPDMPKAAFYFMWENIKAGRTFGAYVKNRAKCGRHFWVFAVMVPVDGGYLSVGLKPSTSHFEMIKVLYARMLAAEQDGGTQEDGAVLFKEEAQQRGYRDYTAFMGFALGAEIAARSTALERAVDPSIGEFGDMGDLLVKLSDEVSHIKLLFDGISSSPKNLNILGSRLTVGREAIQVVAQNYEHLSAELLKSIIELENRLHAFLDTAFNGRMGHCASLLYSEAIDAFAMKEPNRGTPDHQVELAILQGALDVFRQVSEEGCNKIAHEVEKFSTLTGRLRQMLSGLAVTRVICRIEAASISEDTSSIEEISERLTVFQAELGKSLDRIGNTSAGLAKCIPSARKAADRAA